MTGQFLEGVEAKDMSKADMDCRKAISNSPTRSSDPYFGLWEIKC
jgi:hypothetical protein